MMERKDLSFIKDKDTLDLIQHIFEKGQGAIQELSAVPTASVPILNPEEWGYYLTNLYYRKENTIIVIAISSTITVT